MLKVIRGYSPWKIAQCLGIRKTQKSIRHSPKYEGKNSEKKKTNPHTHTYIHTLLSLANLNQEQNGGCGCTV